MEGNLLDAAGCPVSCKCQEAVDSFNKGMLAFVTLNGDAMSNFNKALELDPEFILVHCVLVNYNLAQLFCFQICKLNS